MSSESLTADTMRDDFPLHIKRATAERVAYRCSNPKCQRSTIGPRLEPSKSVNLGVCAHITAASPGGPRYDPRLSSDERKSIKNAIWLCQYCAKLIDNDELRYPVDKLHRWKKLAEQEARREIEGYIQELTMGSQGVTWLWDAKRSSYCNIRTGEIVDSRKIVRLRDIFIEREKLQIDELVEGLLSGDLTLPDWESKFAEAIKTTYLTAYMLANGGPDKFSEADKHEIAVMLRGQYLSLDKFAKDIASGRYIGDPGWVEEHIKLRARTYVDSIRHAIEWP
jgi:hypothetical protein